MLDFSEDFRSTFLIKLKELKFTLGILNKNNSLFSGIINSYLASAGLENTFKNVDQKVLIEIIDEAIEIVEGNINCSGVIIGYLNDSNLSAIVIDLKAGNFSQHYLPIHSGIEKTLINFSQGLGQEILWKASKIFCNL